MIANLHLLDRFEIDGNRSFLWVEEGDHLQLSSLGNLNDGAVVEKIMATCEQILTEEGG